MPKQVKYFFAFHSPYAALADWRIDDLVAKAGGELVPVPIVPPRASPLTGLAAQLQGFKMDYIAEDAARWAAKIAMPWKPPPWGPIDTTDAVAGCHFARERGRERAYRNAVFRALWCRTEDIADRTVLAGCATAAGLDRDAYLTALDDARYRDEIPKALVLCLEERIFGVPMFVVDGQRFWGNDRIDFVLQALRGG